jgi:hypothetical protein
LARCDKDRSELDGSATPYDNFLYLLFEMEQAIERGHIKWPADQADLVLCRLARIAEKVALASKPHAPTRLT